MAKRLTALVMVLFGRHFLSIQLKNTNTQLDRRISCRGIAG